MKFTKVKDTYKNFCIILICTLLLIVLLHITVQFDTMKAFGVSNDYDSNSKTPIKHIIVISQGKRSFDNYFGTFPGANGLPQNLTIPLNPFPPGLKSFTVVAWFSTNKTFTNNAFIVSKGGVGADAPGYNSNYGIWINTNGNVIAGFETSEGIDNNVVSNQKYNDGKWHNVAVTYDGRSNLILFMDGNPVASRNTGGAAPDILGTNPIRIGSNSFQPENYFIGSIDDVGIWNKTLTELEIKNGFNNDIYSKDKQVVFESFENNDIHISNLTNSAEAIRHKGVYLNGSTYEDLKLDISKLTTYIKPFHLNNTKTESPNHGKISYLMSYNNGQLDGFAFSQLLERKDPRLVMGYYNGNDLHYYWKFASDFVLADNFFAPTMDTGFVNENYLFTASDINNYKNMSFRDLNIFNKTIFHNLEESGVSWKIYVDDYHPLVNNTKGILKYNRFIDLLTSEQRMVSFNKTLNSNIFDLVQYFKDLRGDLPAFSYIMAPNYEENSPRDVTIGEEFVASLVLALMKSNHWNDSVFIITYREPGGWFDHVSPPRIKNDFNGFRVPTLIISPYAKKGYLDSTQYDVTSILKFIEYNYNIPPLSERDSSANSLINAFNFTMEPRKPSLSNYTNLIQPVDKKIERNISVIPINLAYLITLSLIIILGLLFGMISYRQRTEHNFQTGNKS